MHRGSSSPRKLRTTCQGTSPVLRRAPCHLHVLDVVKSGLHLILKQLVLLALVQQVICAYCRHIIQSTHIGQGRSGQVRAVWQLAIGFSVRAHIETHGGLGVVVIKKQQNKRMVRITTEWNHNK